MNNKIEISDLPVELYEYLHSKKLTTLNQCFTNCLMSVINTLCDPQWDLSYVLVSVSFRSSTVPHAVIGHRGEYFDPTIEQLNIGAECVYTIEREFCGIEIWSLLYKRFSKQEIFERMLGEKPWWPLLKTGHNKYEFIDPDSFLRSPVQ